MKKKLIIIGLCFSSSNLNAACNTGAIEYKHETGFGISLGSGGAKTKYNDSTSINVPLTLNGEQACFRKKNKLSLKAVNSKESDTGKIIISPMVAEFENIPNPMVRQYLFVEKNKEKTQTKFHTMSFVCAGELPLSVEAASDSYSKIYVDSNKTEVNVTTVFATGIAAENISNSRRALSSQGTFDFFAKIYKLKTSKELDSTVCCTQKIPSIISDSSINSLAGIERTIASSFTTLGAKVPNGCSSEFAESMTPYLIENYEMNDSLKDYKVSKKWFSSDLVFEWK